MAVTSTGTPAVFLDKDGTLIEDVPYNVDPQFIRLMPAAREALTLLHRAGYRLFVISNQSGVARGYFTEAEIAAVGDHLAEVLDAWGVPLAGFHFCPHYPDGRVEAYTFRCACRKPEPGLILDAAERHGIDLRRSWFLGDIESDVEAGRRAGCGTILVRDRRLPPIEFGPGSGPDHFAADLLEAACFIAGFRVAERNPGQRERRHAAEVGS